MHFVSPKSIMRAYRFDYLLYISCLIALALASYFHILPHFVGTLVLLIAWLPIAWRAVHELSLKQLGNNFFLTIATLFSFLAKEEVAIIIVLIIMHIAYYAELLIEHQTRDALEGIIKLIPTQVTVRVDNNDTLVPLDEVVPGNVVVVATGKRIPVDGVITEGSASINESSLTGESTLQEKTVGDQVFAGTFIESGSLIIKTLKVKQETLFGKMTSLLVQAEQNKAHITILTEKIVTLFTPAYLLLIIVVWLFTKNFDVVLTLLIFGSPLELALITPLSILAGTVAAFRHGILIKNGRALETFAQADTMIFDKTGTLTLGEPRIVDVVSYSTTRSPQDIIFIAAVAEKHADHVVAKALKVQADKLKLVIPDPQDYISVVGHGVEIRYNDTQYFFGNKHFTEAAEHAHSPIPRTVVPCSNEQSHSIFYLASQGSVLGTICMADEIRPEAQATITKLYQTGFHDIMLLSGDRQEITDTIAQKLHIKKSYGEMFPDQKLTIVQELQQQGHIVAMVGDGINDVAALKQAHVGIAMGAMGMEPAINAADIVLMTNDLQKIYFTRALAQKVFHTIRQNLLIGFVMLHIVGIVLTLMHVTTPLQAACAHAVSDVLILMNASRLIAFNVK